MSNKQALQPKRNVNQLKPTPSITQKRPTNSVQKTNKEKAAEDKPEKTEKPASEEQEDLPDDNINVKSKALQIFQKFDKFEDGKVDLKHLETMLHLLNQALTREQLNQVKQFVQEKYPEQEMDDIRIKFDDFYEIVDDIYEPMGLLRRRLTVAFQILDTEHSGLIGKSELALLLTQVGDVLTDLELKEFMQSLPPSKDLIPIEAIVNALCSNGRKTKKETKNTIQKKA